jgi:hypothetical protein
MTNTLKTIALSFGIGMGLVKGFDSKAQDRFEHYTAEGNETKKDLHTSPVTPTHTNAHTTHYNQISAYTGLEGFSVQKETGLSAINIQACGFSYKTKPNEKGHNLEVVLFGGTSQTNDIHYTHLPTLNRTHFGLTANYGLSGKKWGPEARVVQFETVLFKTNHEFNTEITSLNEADQYRMKNKQDRTQGFYRCRYFNMLHKPQRLKLTDNIDATFCNYGFAGIQLSNIGENKSTDIATGIGLQSNIGIEFNKNLSFIYAFQIEGEQPDGFKNLGYTKPAIANYFSLYYNLTR